MRIRNLVGELHVGNGSQIGALTWFPIWSERGSRGRPSLVPRAGGPLTITECPQPTVPLLAAVNRGPSPALLVQGTTLRGGSQDRMCVGTVLVPPRATLEVPVACIERGRWARASRDLQLTEVVPPRVRARNAAAGQPARDGRVAGDQVGTWSEVDELFRTHRRGSPTDSYHDLRRDLRSESTAPIRAIDGQRGVAIGYSGSIRTIELFGNRRDLRRMLAPTLEATQIEAVGEPPAPVSARRARRAVAELGRIEVTSTPSLGWGEDLHAEDETFITTGLRHRTSLLHLAAFSRQLILAA